METHSNTLFNSGKKISNKGFRKLKLTSFTLREKRKKKKEEKSIQDRVTSQGHLVLLLRMNRHIPTPLKEVRPLFLHFSFLWYICSGGARHLLNFGV